MKPSILLCTVGTSLFLPNLEGLQTRMAQSSLDVRLRPLATAYTQGEWLGVASALEPLGGSDRTCGAEINSITSLVQRGYVAERCGLIFFHSSTDDGRDIAEVLGHYYRSRGHSPVEVREVDDLQDADPKRFRTSGLRNLARGMCGVLQQFSPAACAINATGGYKAQIAIAVLLGQAVGVPVLYKHERFDEVIAFPPMPVALDFGVWLRASGMLFQLARAAEPVIAHLFEDEWDERYESLIERVEIDGTTYLELSPTGQIFHETFRNRFQSQRDRVLPPAASAAQKRPPRLEAAGWPGENPEIARFFADATQAVGPVIQCVSFYYNPDRPDSTRFRQSVHGIEGIYSNGTYCAKFRIESTAVTDGQSAAVVAALNEWLASR